MVYKKRIPPVRECNGMFLSDLTKSEGERQFASTYSLGVFTGIEQQCIYPSLMKYATPACVGERISVTPIPLLLNEGQLMSLQLYKMNTSQERQEMRCSITKNGRKGVCKALDDH